MLGVVRPKTHRTRASVLLRRTLTDTGDCTGMGSLLVLVTAYAPIHALGTSAISLASRLLIEDEKVPQTHREYAVIHQGPKNSTLNQYANSNKLY